MKEGLYSRTFDASKEMLYKAWADPSYLKRWWGPNGFTNTFDVFEFVPGGKWMFTMHGPDGKNYANESVFVTMVPNELILFDHLSAPKFRVEASFKSVDSNHSELNWKMIFEEEAVFRSIKDFIAEKNEENLNRLEAVLKQMK